MMVIDVRNGSPAFGEGTQNRGEGVLGVRGFCHEKMRGLGLILRTPGLDGCSSGAAGADRQQTLLVEDRIGWLLTDYQNSQCRMPTSIM